MANLVSIGRFSNLSGLSQKTIRLYGSLGLLRPAHVDAFTGYRYYAPGQVSEARTIARLRSAGRTLRDITSFLAMPSSNQLDEWERQLDMETIERRRQLHAVRRILAGGHETEETAMTNTHDDKTDVGRLHFYAISPVLQVDDVNAAAAHYRDALGFEIYFLHGEPATYATVGRDHATIHLSRVHPAGVRNNCTAAGAPDAADAFIFVGDVDDLHDELRARGAGILTEPQTYPWGQREFMVEDLNGYHLIFGAALEQ